jgi:UDP-N-acetylglucosamine 2-epimerase (non-hydrolysing)
MSAARENRRLTKVMTVFGTRPEIIKLAPVIAELERHPVTFHTVNVASGQHEDLLRPFLRSFGIRLDHHLHVMVPGQTPNGLCSRVLAALDPVLVEEAPDLLLVQGDTTTAMAGALAAFHRRIPVGHVEAGLRSGDVLSPYPEEMNRRVITQLATHHFAATLQNRAALVAEGVRPDRIFVTGNPVVDVLKGMLARPPLESPVAQLLDRTAGQRRVVLTTHRRESFGDVMVENLRVLRRFVERHRDVELVFPVHPNPVVVAAAEAALSHHPRIHLIAPLGYEDFIRLLSQAWLIVSDSGGVQEEAPTLGKPLLVIRENTERPEALQAGVARLVGGRPERLADMLEEAWSPGSWAERAAEVDNPFGRGDAGARIAQAIARIHHPSTVPHVSAPYAVGALQGES